MSAKKQSPPKREVIRDKGTEVSEKPKPTAPATKTDEHIKIPSGAFVHVLTTTLGRGADAIISELRKLKTESRLECLANGYLPIDAYILIGKDGSVSGEDRAEFERVLRCNLIEPKNTQYLSEDRVKRAT